MVEQQGCSSNRTPLAGPCHVKKVVGGKIDGVCAMSGIHFTSRIVAQSENGGCVRDSDGNWYGVIKDGRIGLELEQAYERDVLTYTK